MKFFIAAILMAFSVNVFALNTMGLSPEQEAELTIIAEKMKKDNKRVPVTPEQVHEWASIGDAIGTSLVDTASKLGVAANEFATSPVGMIVMALIVWSYAGSEIVGVVVGSMWLIFGISTWVWMYRRRFVIDSISYYEKGARGWTSKGRHVKVAG